MNVNDLSQSIRAWLINKPKPVPVPPEKTTAEMLGQAINKAAHLEREALIERENNYVPVSQRIKQAIARCEQLEKRLGQ